MPCRSVFHKQMKKRSYTGGISELCIEFPPPLCYTCGRDGGSQHQKNDVTACHRLRPPKKNTEQRGWKNGTGKAFAIARHLSCQARSAHRLFAAAERRRPSRPPYAARMAAGATTTFWIHRIRMRSCWWRIGTPLPSSRPMCRRRTWRCSRPLSRTMW